MLNDDKLKNMLTSNESLFDYIFVVNQEFDILPKNKKHYGVSIDYLDLKELRKEFLNELIDTVADFVYSSEKFNQLKEKSLKAPLLQMNGNCALIYCA